MEHSKVMHLPFAKGRIENGLAPAPRIVKRPFYIRWAEALSVLKGRSIGVKCYEDMEDPIDEQYVEGKVGSHPIVDRPAE